MKKLFIGLLLFSVANSVFADKKADEFIGDILSKAKGYIGEVSEGNIKVFNKDALLSTYRFKYYLKEMDSRRGTYNFRGVLEAPDGYKYEILARADGTVQTRDRLPGGDNSSQNLNAWAIQLQPADALSFGIASNPRAENNLKMSKGRMNPNLVNIEQKLRKVGKRSVWYNTKTNYAEKVILTNTVGAVLRTVEFNNFVYNLNENIKLPKIVKISAGVADTVVYNDIEYSSRRTGESVLKELENVNFENL